MSDSATITREDAGKDVPVTKLAIASTIGTIIEAYDFVLYGTVAALVFDKLFFPDAAPVVATLAAFATFGVGFLARPVGGVIFGHYGDKVGRKKMLVLALVIMGVATVLIGALPGYDSIGIWAPILLVTLRLIQGAALGGEWGGAVLMVTEYAPKGKRGFYGSWPQIGFAGGLAISTSLIWIMSTSLSDAAFESWGWRVPFFASALLVGVGLWIRLKIEETPAFTELKEKQERESAPAVEVFRDHKKPVLRAMGMRFSENITFYMLIVFALSYGEDELGISRNTLLAAIIICAVGSCIVIPMWGALTDRVGRRPVFLWGAIASVVLAAAFFPLLQTGSALIIILLFVIVMNTAHDAQYATEASYFSEMFPTKIRYSGISISAQLGGVFAGAFAPLIATALLDVSGIWLVSVYFAVMCSVSAIAAYFSPETYQEDFMGQPTQRAHGPLRPQAGRGARDRRSMTWKPTTEPVVITCALTGGIHGKEANEALPEQPDEIVAQGIDAWRAGAAVLHVHARNPDGSNTMDPEIYGELHERLCAETDAVVQLTTGGSPRLSVEERITTVRLAPEMCSLNMGLLNFFIRGEQVFFPNHRDDIERFAHEIREHDVRPELEVYSVPMLEEVEHLLSLEILEPPYAINLVLHTPTQGGQRGTPRNLVDAVERIRDLPVDPDDVRVTVTSMGPTQLPLTTIGIAMGLNVRVGMEDNVLYRRGEPVVDNAQLVERTVRIAKELDRRPASPDEARERFALRGRVAGAVP